MSDERHYTLGPIFDYAEFLLAFKHANKERWAKVLRRDPCSYCGAYGEPTIEHVTPGRYKSDRVENRAAACRVCNHARGSTKLLWYLLERCGVVTPEVEDRQARVLARSRCRLPALTVSIGERIIEKRGHRHE